jgi:cytochrome c oxidase assembly factor CtaG
VSGSPYRFGFEPLFLVLALVALVLYVRAVRGTASAERPSSTRRWAFGCGVALVALPLNSPLETLSAHYLLLMHLLQNALIADWGPPLLILGLTPAFRRAVVVAGGGPLRLVTKPVVALPIWLIVWYGVHVPSFYNWALRDGWPLNFEHLLLVLAGLVFWWPVFERPPRIESLGVLAYLGLGFLSAPWLSLAYIFSSRPFYSFYAHAPRLWGLSAVKDQNLAGILMNADQTSIFFIAFAWHLLRVLGEEEEDQRRKDAVFLRNYDGAQGERSAPSAPLEDEQPR